MTEILNSTAVWTIYECNQFTCDLSNWFAELIFGVMIGLGILAWQILSNKNRSHIFAQQIFDEVIPLTLDLARSVESVKFDQDGDPKKKTLPDGEYNAILRTYQENQKNRIRIQERLDASGTMLSAKMQEETQILVDKLANSLPITTDRERMTSALDRMLMQCISVCKESKISKREIKNRISTMNKSISKHQTEDDYMSKYYIERYSKTKKDLESILKYL